ncbi:unnamed protein product [Peronospora effusa]|nr:unnamed protein product [Peronospora effusa]
MLLPELDDNGLDISMGANQLLTPQLYGAMMWSTRDCLSGSLSQDTGAYNATAAVAINGGGPNLTFQFHRALVAATTGKLSLRANLATAARQSAMEQQKRMFCCAKEKMEQEQQREDGKELVILLGRYGKNLTSSDQRKGRGDAFDVALRTMPEHELNQEVGDEDDTDSGDSIAQQEGDAEVLKQKWIDVSIPLQFFVKLGDLALSSASKVGLLGFYNPFCCDSCLVVSLTHFFHFWNCGYVHYAYDGQVFEATFDDDQAVSLPSRYAQVMGPIGRVY